LNNLLAAGAIVNSALYLTGVFVAAAMYGHKTAVVLAIAAAGVTFVSYSAQVLTPERRGLCAGLSIGSSAIGLIAGLALLVGMI